MNKYRLILHGKAAARPPVRAAVAALREQGVDLEVRVTWEAGDSQRLAVEAVKDGVATVIAGGGDGTLNEVASTLSGLASGGAAIPSFGILPLGTANDFARSCHVPLDPLAALQLVAETKPRAMDLGRDGDRSFINVATGGVGTEITVETPEDLKKLLGGAAYFVTAIKRLASLKAAEVTFRGPEFEWSGPVAVLGIGNGRQAGGGNVLCPHARINDGLLDVTILPDLDPAGRQDLIRDLVSEGLAAVEKRAVTARVPWVEIESASPFQVNLDGEPVKKTSFRFEAVPSALLAHLPEECPLVGK